MYRHQNFCFTVFLQGDEDGEENKGRVKNPHWTDSLAFEQYETETDAEARQS